VSGSASLARGPPPAGCAGHQDIVINVNRPTKVTAFLKKAGEGTDLAGGGSENLRGWDGGRWLFRTSCWKQEQGSEDKSTADRSGRWKARVSCGGFSFGIHQVSHFSNGSQYTGLL